MRKLIELENVWGGYSGQTVLSNVSLPVFENDYIGIIGPNGGGKTTLIKLILGLIKPTKGLIHSYLQNGETIGYLPQQSHIDRKFPIRVKDIVVSGLMSHKGIFKRYTSSDTEQAEALLKQMGILHLRNKTIGEISGGQFQRVLICRAIISNPKLLILDEPNTFVDNKFEKELYEALGEFNQRMAIMMITHDVGTISYFVKTIACVNNHLHYHPSNIITAEQLASYNCPIQIITHGDVPHTVLQKHEDGCMSHVHNHQKH